MDEPSGGTLRFSGHWILTNVFVTQANILTSVLSILTSVKTSPNNRTLPYLFEKFYLYRVKLTLFNIKIKYHSFGRSLSPGHCRRNIALPVSYYALFQGWLLLGKPPGCLCTLTSFATERSFRGLSWWSGLFPS